MTAPVTSRPCGDGYELVAEDRVVGRLVWTAACAPERQSTGWWLEVPGAGDELIYRVPAKLVRDPDRARRAGEPASLGLAVAMMSDREEGLLDRAPDPRPPTARS
jgi:hypothetical protein